MNQDKLEALRKRFAASTADEIEIPSFKAVADVLFADAGNRSLPYSGLPTFLDMPYREDLKDLDIGIVGVPMDLGVTNRSGARFGPRAIRAIERTGPYHHALDVLPVASHRIADIGDVPFRSRYSLEQSIDDIEAHFTKIVDAGIRPLAVGGDHSISYPILKALGRNAPVGMIHIDAHCDTMGEMDGSKFHHGGPFRYAVLDGVLDPERCVQIGIRGSSEFLWEFSYVSGMTVIHAEEVDQMGLAAIIKSSLEVVGKGPVYVTLDVDGIDPAFAPGTGTPEVGGLTPREVQAILRGLAGCQIIGGDVVEVAPQYDANTTTAALGAQMLFEILCLMTLSPDPG
jgi:agmatinase